MQEKSILYQNHGQKLHEELRHRVPEDPYYASVSGGIRRLEVHMKDITEERVKQQADIHENLEYGVGFSYFRENFRR